MKQALAIVGGPGAGKTRRLLEHVAAEVRAGVAPEQIAVVAFTKAAQIEVRSRLAAATGLAPDRFPWVRTIHSAALQMCKGGKLFVEEQWAEFAKLHGYTFSDLPTDDDLAVPPSRTPDDQLRYVYDWGRNRRLEPHDAFDRCGRARVRRDLFDLYVARYEAYKRENELVDFVDLLQRVLARRAVLPVTVGFVDEAQDLSQLQAEVVETFFADCERTYAAGDDDQAIYLFQGGQADWFVTIAEEHRSEVLSVSHRLPAVVHELSQRIIARNKNRIAKRFEPTARQGRILCVPYVNATDCVDGTRETLVLARNRMYLRDQARALQSRGVPYVIEGDGWPNPLGSARLVRAVNTAEELRVGKTAKVAAKALADVLLYVPRESGLIGEDVREVVRIAAKRAAWLVVADAGLDALIAALRANGPVSCFTRLTGENSRYLDRLVREHGVLPEPMVRLNSIHGAKGREADLVVLVSDMTQATYDEYLTPSGAEGENRVFYVGVTRTRDTLVLVEPKTRRHFDYPALPSEVLR